MTKLNYLTLWDNKLSSLPEQIAELQNLEHLYLDMNPLPKVERDKISRLLPHCKVEF